MAFLSFSSFLLSPLLRVIVEEESLADWSSKLVEIKRSFIQFPEQLKDSRVEGVCV